MKMSIVTEVLQTKSTARNNKVNDCGFENHEACDFSAELQCQGCDDKNTILWLKDEELRQVKESLKQTQRRMVKLSATNDEISRKLADLHATEKWRAKAEAEVTYWKDNYYKEILARRLREAEDKQRRKCNFIMGCFGFFWDIAIVVAAMVLGFRICLEDPEIDRSWSKHMT